MKRFAWTLSLLLALPVLASAQGKAPVSTKYIAAAEALAADNYAKAKIALEGLAAESQGDVKTKAQAAAGAKNIAAMRKEFRTLSEIIIKMAPPKGYAVAFCPMYEGGSSWIQKQGDIANPYYGKEMSDCGVLQK